MAQVDGQVAATMHRRIADTVTFDLHPHRPVTRTEEQALTTVARRYGEHLERPARLVVRS